MYTAEYRVYVLNLVYCEGINLTEDDDDDERLL